MQHLKLGNLDKALVQISVEHQSNQRFLVENMVKYLRDRRRLNEGDIINVITAIVSRPAQPQENEQPIEKSLVQKVIEECSLGAESELLKRVLPGRIEVFEECFNDSTLRELELMRIPDKVEYLIYRQDGTLAGPIEKVSVGQKGLAFLNLLLAAGNEPLIVDTPEEGLDNEGVYSELVPIFRREKEKRQIIVVTHNANIPVNADAEVIVSLEAVGFVSDVLIKEWVTELDEVLNDDQIKHVQTLIRYQSWETSLTEYLISSRHWQEGKAAYLIRRIGENRQAKGRIRTWKEAQDKPTELCIGALDCTGVKNSVQDIMEGSEEAFTKRREKYGF